MDTLLLDISNLAHRNHAVLSDKGIKKPLMYGMIRDILFLRRTFPNCKLVFCFDSPCSKRKEVYSNYKANKKPTSSSFQDQLKEIGRCLLPDLGFYNVFEFDGAEADDVIAHLCNVSAGYKKFVIVSSDKDLYQLLCHDMITMWLPVIKKEFTQGDLFKKYGVTPEQWIKAKAIMGDKSDNITGVWGVGIKYAIKYITGNVAKETSIRHGIDANKTLIESNEDLIRLPYKKLTTLPVRVCLQKDDANSKSWDRTMVKYGLYYFAGKFV